jgi:hypothetical protein
MHHERSFEEKVVETKVVTEAPPPWYNSEPNQKINHWGASHDQQQLYYQESHAF